MTFKSRQNALNSYKKENDNKEYRHKYHVTNYRFATRRIDPDYILRTEKGIKVNQRYHNYLGWSFSHYQHRQPFPLEYGDHSPEDNETIMEVLNEYHNTNKYKTPTSRDKTHTEHSKTNTKNRQRDRYNKWLANEF